MQKRLVVSVSSLVRVWEIYHSCPGCSIGRMCVVHFELGYCRLLTRLISYLNFLLGVPSGPYMLLGNLEIAWEIVTIRKVERVRGGVGGGGEGGRREGTPQLWPKLLGRSALPLPPVQCWVIELWVRWGEPTWWGILKPFMHMTSNIWKWPTEFVAICLSVTVVYEAAFQPILTRVV